MPVKWRTASGVLMATRLATCSDVSALVVNAPKAVRADCVCCSLSCTSSGRTPSSSNHATVLCWAERTSPGSASSSSTKSGLVAPGSNCTKCSNIVRCPCVVLGRSVHSLSVVGNLCFSLGLPGLLQSRFGGIFLFGCWWFRSFLSAGSDGTAEVEQYSRRLSRLWA